MTAGPRGCSRQWCVDHDPEGICRADDLDTADGWTVALTLADDDGRPIVGMTHPDALPAPEIGALTPAEAYALGWALITQDTRGGFSPTPADARR